MLINDSHINLNQHRVMLTLVDLEESHVEATHILSQITEAYAKLTNLKTAGEIYGWLKN